MLVVGACIARPLLQHDTAQADDRWSPLQGQTAERGCSLSAVSLLCIRGTLSVGEGLGGKNALDHSRDHNSVGIASVRGHYLKIIDRLVNAFGIDGIS